MAQRNGFSLFSLALFVAIATPPALVTAFMAEPQRLLAQTSEASPVPTPFAIPTGAQVRIDGSESLELVNEELKQRYEDSFEGAEVLLETNGTPAAMQALRDGEIDIATIGRSLTEAEIAEGFQAIALPREKIAIIVGSDNPFAGDLTFDQFAQIFRGDITDWSEVGGEPGPIRLVDRADESDTRTALSLYEVWSRLGGFVPGATVEQLNEDSTDAVVTALGRDGIGYAAYSKVRDRTDVTIIPMHQTLPDDPAYPYSKPRTLVYLDEPTPPVAAFIALASGATVTAAAADPTAEDPAAIGAAPDAAEEPIAATEESDVTAGEADGAVVAPTDGAAGVTPVGGDAAEGADANGGGWLPWLALLLLPLLPLFLKLFRRSPQSTPNAPIFPEGGVSARAADVLGGRGAAGGAAPAVGSGLNVTGAVGGAAIAGMGLAGTAAGAAALAGGGDRPPSRIVLAPRNRSTGYAYWETPAAHRQALVDQGGRDMKLRVYDVTDVSHPETADLSHLAPQRLHQVAVDEVDQDAHLILERDRDYLTEIGYETGDGHWLTLARSNKIRLNEAAGLAATNGAGKGMGAGAAALGITGAVAGLAGAAALAGREQPTSRIVLTPRGDAAGYAYWEAPSAHREELKRQGGRDLFLRIYDVTDVVNPETADLSGLFPQRLQQVQVDETAQDAHVSLECDRDYLAEIGYSTGEGQWLPLARSKPIRLSGATGVTPAEATGEKAVGEFPASAAAIAGVALVGGAIAQNLKPEGDDTLDEQATVEAAKYDVGQTDLSSEKLADVDDNLPDLPEGYGQSRILLLPRDPQWAYAYWDTPNDHKEEMRRQGGQKLALRLFDVTDIADINKQRPHSLLEYECDELARDWYLRIPVSDRDYIAEIGYLTADGRWLMLARSNPIRIPPVYPSDWYEENFIDVEWGTDLAGRTFYQLTPPGVSPSEALPLYARMYGMAESAESQRVAGSLFGSMHQVPGSMQMASGQALETMESGKAFETMASGQAFETMQMTSGQAFETMQMTSGQAFETMQMTSGQAFETMQMTSGQAFETMQMTSGQAFEMMTSGRAFETMQMASGQALTSLGMGWGQIPSASGRGFETFPFGGVSSFIMASGMGMGVMRGWGVPESRMIEEERSMSGIGMSGIGMSGIGFFSSMPPIRARKFWLVADAELIVYGATEPDAMVFVNGNPIKLEPDGTFRFHMPFPDGLIDFPIMAIAADGEQTRAVHMKFNRETPYRRTNKKDEAQDEAY